MPPPRLPDVLPHHAAIVFCGTAAKAVSAARGAYYAGPGNQFWGVLERVGLTPRRLRPEEFPALAALGIGLTDVEKQRAGSDAEALTGTPDLDALQAKLDEAAPTVVAFNGKRAAAIALGRAVTYGRQPERLGGAEIWVLPSTSGAARGAWDEAIWRRCATRVRHLVAATVAGTPSARRVPSTRTTGRKRG